MRVKLCSLVSAASLSIFAARRHRDGGDRAFRARRPRPARAAPPRPSRRSRPKQRSTLSAAAATPSTPRSPPPRCLASPSRSRAASAAAASSCSGPPAAPSRRSTTARPRPAAMRADSFWENGAPLAVQRRPASAACRSASPARSPAGRTRSTATERSRSRRRCSPRSGSRASGFLIDQTFFDQTQGNVDFFDDVPASAGALPRPRRDAEGRRHRLPQPGPRARLRADRASRREGLLPRCDRGRARRDGAEPTSAPTANHVWRPGLMTMRDLHTYAAPERAPTRVSLPRPRRLRDGPAFERRLDRRRGAQHPRGLPTRDAMTRERQLHLFLEASRYAFADRGAYLGDADFVRVPLRGLLSDGFAATRRALITENAAARRRRARRSLAVRRRRRNAARWSVLRPEGLSTTHLSVSDSSGNVVSYTFTIESTGGAGLVVPGWGFLLNNELTDFDFSLLQPPEQRRGRKAPAQLDGAHDRQPGGPHAADGRIAGRLDDHHDRPAAPARSTRYGNDAAAGDRRPARDAAERRHDCRRSRPSALRRSPRRSRRAGTAS